MRGSLIDGTVDRSPHRSERPSVPEGCVSDATNSRACPATIKAIAHSRNPFIYGEGALTRPHRVIIRPLRSRRIPSAQIVTESNRLSLALSAPRPWTNSSVLSRPNALLKPPPFASYPALTATSSLVSGSGYTWVSISRISRSALPNRPRQYSTRAEPVGSGSHEPSSRIPVSVILRLSPSPLISPRDRRAP